jgi:HEAT repeat protein/cyclophilin family peptidyl-prolyl cis-trans isomerase
MTIVNSTDGAPAIRGPVRKRLSQLTYVLSSCAIAACASAPPASPPPPGPPFAQKMAWILRFEDQRILRDPVPVSPPPAPPAVPPPRGKKAPVVPPPPPPPDLIRLLSDSEARVRRRAALAVGRAGLREAVQPLAALLTDADPEVRQMAAFALGLIGDKGASERLVAALGDPSPLVQGSAAEALGLIGDSSAADAVGRMAAQVVQSGVLAQTPSDEDEARRDSPAAAFRLSIEALVRLKAYEPLAQAVLDQSGQPLVRWWPVAYALARLEDKRAFNALLTLATDPQPYTRAFAVKGLGALKDRAAGPTLVPLVGSPDRGVAVEAIRALGRIGDSRAAGPLLAIVEAQKPDPVLRLEAVGALGGVQQAGVLDALLDASSDPNPAVRAAALRATAQYDPDNFVAVLSGLDPDPNWSVRAAIATALGTLPPDVALPRLTTLLEDKDQRVVRTALTSLVKLRAPNAAKLALDHLKADDPVVRAASAAGVGELKPANGAEALADAFRDGQRDATYLARAAALEALTKYGAAAAVPVLTTALADKDWAVRVRAAALLKQLDPTADVDMQIRPAPTQLSTAVYEATRLVDPPVSTQVYIDTDRGTIQLELAVLDAPLTVENFITLARKGYFDGLSVHRVVPDFVIQTGDPRGDGEGGPGYTIRDELNERPYFRGTVGMALDWADTGGSQFFITHSPQPHLDAKYTVFGRVVAGMDVVDRIQQWDVIRRVRVWDGKE